MDPLGQKGQKLSRSRDSLDRKVDQWIETGRQFVDGVAGNRPGQRRSFRSGRDFSPSVDKVGRWVSQKIDWFLEEDEDWLEPLENSLEQKNEMVNKKKPLDAISKRVSNFSNQSKSKFEDYVDNNQWPEDSDYKVNKWVRREIDENIPLKSRLENEDSKSNINQRRLPKSSRRRK
tara:strand:- start:4181 stop:4705 length:525 start_codon:yes stop_codon:yes gene_type:complete